MEQAQTRRNSPTSILTYLRCPREYYYRYVLRLPTPQTDSLIKGSVCHEVLEKFYEEYTGNLEERMVKLFGEVWEKYLPNWIDISLTKEELETHRKDCLNMLELYFYMYNMRIQNLIEAGKAENERHAFYITRPKFRELWVEDKDLNIAGYIDRIHKDFDGIITIGDYKTSNHYGIGITQDYDLQCGIYALLYKRIYGELPHFTSIIYLRTGFEVRTRVTPGHIKWAIDMIDLVNEKTKSDNIEDYPMIENGLCKICPHFDKDSGLEALKDRDLQKKFILEKMEKVKQDAIAINKGNTSGTPEVQ